MGISALLDSVQNELRECTARRSVPSQSPFPYKVTWDITHKCNMRCTHCFVIYQNNSNLVSLGTDRSLSIAASIKDAAPFIVSIAGGEPFLEPALMSIIEDFLDAGIQVIVATNATLITDEMIDRMSVYNGFSLQISLDGVTAASNDRIRGSGNFQRTLDTIHRINGGIKVTVASTLTKDICSSLEDSMSFLCTLPVSAIKLQRMIITDSVPEKTDAPSTQLFILAKEQLARFLKNRNVTQPQVIHPFGLFGTAGEFSIGSSCMGPSAIGLRECTITPSGELVGCGAALDEAESVGSVLEEPFVDVWRRLGKIALERGGRAGTCKCDC